jgi:hypothetical protein
MLDTTTDTGGYILGLLWGTMSTWEEGYWFRHRDRWYVDAVRDYLGITAAVQEVASSTGPQYRLKIVRTEWVESLSSLLESQNWAPRNAQERAYPSGSLNDRGFCRAWVELHSSVDIHQAKRRNGTYYPQKRLRIYGNAVLMEEMNYVLSSAAGLEPRKLQRTANEITKAIIFQGKTVFQVVEWLYAGAEIWNPAARARLEFKNNGRD